MTAARAPKRAGTPAAPVTLPRPVECGTCGEPFRPAPGWLLWPSSGHALCPDCARDERRQAADDSAELMAKERRRDLARRVARWAELVYGAGCVVAVVGLVVAFFILPPTRSRP